eukprot:scaffold8005_cov118-Isochrysis_galbana.AAC.17
MGNPNTDLFWACSTPLPNRGKLPPIRRRETIPHRRDGDDGNTTTLRIAYAEGCAEAPKRPTDDDIPTS